MNGIEAVLRYAHIGLGFLGLAAFWIPIFSKKGAKNHVFFGKAFVYIGYIVLGSATLSLIIHTSQGILAGRTPLTHPNQYGFIVFLAYLSFITFMTLRHAVGVLHTKHNPKELATLTNRTIAISGIIFSLLIIAYGLYFKPEVKILLFALSPIGLLGGRGMLSYYQQKNSEPQAWLFEHLGGMIGGGIAFHTAFSVFGSRAFFDYNLQGWTAVIPWVLPTLIGVPASMIWSGHYRRKFSHLKQRPSA